MPRQKAPPIPEGEKCGVGISSKGPGDVSRLANFTTKRQIFYLIITILETIKTMIAFEPDFRDYTGVNVRNGL
jgi:hypothetical protein